MKVIVNFQTNPGQGDALAQGLIKALEFTRTQPGCNSADLYRNEDDADSVYLWEDWDSSQQHKDYVNMIMESGKNAELMELLAKPPESVYCHSG